MLLPSVLWCCWLNVRKSIWPVKTEWWGIIVIICLEWGANDLHMVHPIISCFIKIHIGLTFLVLAYPGCPGKEAIKQVSVCHCCLAQSEYSVSRLILMGGWVPFLAKFAICCHPSIYRLLVTLVHPTQEVEIFGNISMAFGTLAMGWHPLKITRRSSQGNPSARELNTRGSQI